ncbi:hypothetical protein U8330_10790 [Rhizobium sp. CC-YZS058]|nr:hypothetical protein [Rhizobium sp. CC-YZS058]MEA3535217.1 hypothetical protein [Rhizobium sp. CC-YZS058]
MAEPLSFDHISLTDRPLIVCDIDEVVLEFLTPFQGFLKAGGCTLLPRSFRLHGNIIRQADGEPISEAEVSALIEAFFAAQLDWQGPAAAVCETLESLSAEADIVFLTAMPPRHAALRRALLDRHALSFPLLATEEPKGPVVRRLHDGRSQKLVFIDDILRNLHSVRDHAPDCLLIHLIANAEFRAMMPTPGPDIAAAADWPHAAALIRAHLAA